MMIYAKKRGIGLAAALFFTFPSAALLQGQAVVPQRQTPNLPHRIHLILKDGTYQVVLSYEVAGKVVRYVSAERSGEQEEIPIELVDLDATHKWEKQHAPVAEGDQGRAPAIDPELLKEEQERSSLTPMVEPDLRLPEEDSVLALDEYQGNPELVPLVQSDGDLNHTTSHSFVKKAINPRSAAHQVVTLHGVKSYVQLHVDTPVFYMRTSEAADMVGGPAMVVDTHGASSAKINNEDSSEGSKYVIVRADVRVDARIISSFNAVALEEHPSEDVMELKSETLPGGHWMKLTPSRPMEFGEYVLMEVLSDKQINLGVWDFGVHPTAPENRDAIKPEPKRRIDMEKRRPE